MSAKANPKHRPWPSALVTVRVSFRAIFNFTRVGSWDPVLVDDADDDGGGDDDANYNC
jgi:hypothetical protein